MSDLAPTTQTGEFGIRSFRVAVRPRGSREGPATWAPTVSMTAPRSNGQTATRLKSGKVMVAGGLGTNETSIPT